MNPRVVNTAVVAGAALACAALIGAALVPRPAAASAPEDPVADLILSVDEVGELLPTQQEQEEAVVGGRTGTPTVFTGYQLESNVLISTVQPAECAALFAPWPRPEGVQGRSLSLFTPAEATTQAQYAAITATGARHTDAAAAHAAFDRLADGYADCPELTYRQILRPQTEYTWQHSVISDETEAGVPVLRLESEMRYRIDDVDYRQVVDGAVYLVGDVLFTYSTASFADERGPLTIGAERFETALDELVAARTDTETGTADDDA